MMWKEMEREDTLIGFGTAGYVSVQIRNEVAKFIRTQFV